MTHGPFPPRWPDELSSRFDCLRFLGGGGMGSVWLARDRSTSDLLAVKTIAARASGRARLRKRFLQEVRAVARLRHPHIVGVRDFFDTGDGTPVLAMEFVDGVSLDALRANPLPWVWLRPLLLQLLRALAFAHARGVIHRDLKPANVLLGLDASGKPTVRIVDFGIARLDDPEAVGAAPRPATRSLLGTLPYMAPEQVTCQWDVSPAVDVWSFGVLLYELVSGALPWSSGAPSDLLTEVVAGRIPPFRPRPEIGAPDALAGVIYRCLRMNPHDRFIAAADLRRALENLDPGRPTSLPATWRGAPDPASATSTFAAIGRGDSDHDLEPATAPLREIPIIGRDHEQRRLRDLARRVLREGGAHLAVLAAPSGYGKSRLAQWLRAEAVEAGVFRPLLLDASRDDLDEALRVSLQDALLVATIDPHDKQRALRVALQALGPGDDERLDDILRLLLDERDPARPRPGRVATWRLWADLLQRLAAQRPLLLLVEGIPTPFPDPLLRFLEWLRSDRGLGDSAALILCAWQVPERGVAIWPDFSAGPVERFRLDRLSPPNAARVVDWLACPEGQRDCVLRQADGIPLLLHDFAGMCRNGAQHDDVCDDPLAMRLEAASLRPRDRDDLLRLVRICALGPDRFDLATLAAALRDRWPELTSQRLGHLLWLASTEHLLDERAGRTTSFAFRHRRWRALVRASTEAWTEAPDWTEAWRSALDERNPTNEVARDRALLLARLGRTQPAATAWLDAARRARRDRAFEALDDALLEAGRLVADSNDPECARIHTDVLLQRARRLHERLRPRAAIDVLDTLQGRLRDDPEGDVRDILVLRARCLVDTAGHEHADRAIELARHADRHRDAAFAPRIDFIDALRHERRGDPEGARALLLRAADAAAASGDFARAAEASLELAVQCACRRDGIRAFEHLTVAEEHATRASDPALTLRAESVRAGLIRARGDLDSARRSHERILDASLAIDDRAGILRERLALAGLAIDGGHLDDADRHLRRFDDAVADHLDDLPIDLSRYRLAIELIRAAARGDTTLGLQIVRTLTGHGPPGRTDSLTRLYVARTVPWLSPVHGADPLIATWLSVSTELFASHPSDAPHLHPGGPPR